MPTKNQNQNEELKHLRNRLKRIRRGYLNNCLVKENPWDDELFHVDKLGRITPQLDGYAIIPMEEYRFITKTSGPEKHKWPCPRCGKKPTKDGHDPCIANLPGVVAACCGHGVETGYVMFEDGRTIRGNFDFQWEDGY